MKKYFVTLILLLLLPYLLFSISNGQKIFSVESDEFKDLETLYIASGHALPSTTGPWSEDELELMLDKINPSLLPENLYPTYERLSSSIKTRERDGNFAWDFKGEVNLELYAHTNTDGSVMTAQSGKVGERRAITIKEKLFQDNRNLIYNYNNNKPFLLLSGDIYMWNNFYGYFGFNFSNTRHAGDEYEKELGWKNIQTNIIMLRDFSFNSGLMAFNFPSRAFVSVGGHGWNLIIGRDKLSWGAGKSGNMTISNNMPWQNFIRFTTYTNTIKYTLLTSFYPHSMNYWDGNNAVGKGTWHAMYNTVNPLEGIRMYIAHRLEGRLFGDKLSLTLTDGLMYMNETNSLDFNALNPFNFNHNNYIYCDTNSTLIFEADYTPIRNLNIYGQFIIDQIAFIGETAPSEKVKENPNAFGYLLGVQGVLPLLGGNLTLSGEFAQTDPYLYLREGEYTNNIQQHNYGINYVVALREVPNSVPGVVYDEYVLGYTYGPDALVGNINALWKNESFPLELEGNLFFMAHGTHDAWTEWQQIGGKKEDVENVGYSWNDYNKNAHSPTTSHTPVNDKYLDADKRDSVEYTFNLGLAGKYTFNKHFSVNMQLDYTFVINHGNVKHDAEHDVQVILGGTFSF